jgi:hypothetical protein
MARPASGGLTSRKTQIMEALCTEGACPADRVRDTLPDRPHDSRVRTLLGIVVSAFRGRSPAQGRTRLGSWFDLRQR